MNRSRHAIALVCRCRKAFLPSLPSQTYSLSKCLTVPNQRRFFATNRNDHDIKEIFPKLPIESPTKFAMDVAQRLFKQVAWSVDNNLEKDEVLSTNASAEEILKFVTECLANRDFDVLEEKLSSEALEKAHAIAKSEPNEELLVFKGTSSGFLFASETRFFAPWVYTAEDKSIILTYIALLASQQRQSIWGITLAIAKDKEGNISEDLKVSDLYFQTFAL